MCRPFGNVPYNLSVYSEPLICNHYDTGFTSGDRPLAETYISVAKSISKVPFVPKSALNTDLRQLHQRRDVRRFFGCRLVAVSM